MKRAFAFIHHHIAYAGCGYYEKQRYDNKKPFPDKKKDFFEEKNEKAQESQQGR